MLSICFPPFHSLVRFHEPLRMSKDFRAILKVTEPPTTWHMRYIPFTTSLLPLLPSLSMCAPLLRQQPFIWYSPMHRTSIFLSKLNLP